MRLVPAMINNTTLMHINRNMRNLDSIIRQIETTKLVSRPSDDPMIASRALKFRSGVREVQQFQRNVDFGLAWMDISESSFINVLDNQLQEIRRLLVAGATGTYNVSEKQIMINQIRELVDHISTLEMNQTYAGRHVFSGFRTDEQAVFTAANERSFVITQHFNMSDIDRTSSFQRLGAPDPNNPGEFINIDTSPPTAHRVNVLKLAFRNLDMVDDNGDPTLDTDYLANTLIQVPGFHVVPFSIHNRMAYVPPATVGELRAMEANNDFDPPLAIDPALLDDMPVLNLVVETGELVMHDDVAAVFPREGVSVTFQKTGFERGDINPAVYFTSRELIEGDPPVVAADRVYQVTQYFSRAAGTPIPNAANPTHFEFGLQFAHSAYPENAQTPSALRGILPPGAYFDDLQTVRIPAALFERNQNISVSYSVEIESGTDIISSNGSILDPNGLKRYLSVQGVRLIRASVDEVDPDTNITYTRPIPIDMAEINRSFDMHNQLLTIEAASHTHVGINSLAKNIFTDKMFADFRRLIEFADAIVISDEGELKRRLENPPHELTEPELSSEVYEQLVNERAIAVDALFIKFDNMLFLIDRHIDQITREHTSLGARAQRLDMLHARLEADEVTLERLTSNNESTDMGRAIMERINAQTAFEASLRANSGIMQLTLANFIN